MRALRIIPPLLWLCAALLLSGAAQAVDYDGYLVKVRELPSLCDAQTEPPPGAEVLPDAGLYQVDSMQAVLRLEHEGRLVYAEPNYLVTLEEVPSGQAVLQAGDTWQLTALGQAWCREQGILGYTTGEDCRPVRIGIVDSGIYSAHQALSTARITGSDYSAEETVPGQFNDTQGHGTFIAGLIAAQDFGIAPEAELVALKCFQGKTASVSCIVRAIHGGYTDYACDVLNMSFGLDQKYETQSLREVIREADSRGVVLIAAAGNRASQSRPSTGNDPLMLPAAYPEVIGVGAVDQNGVCAGFSCQNDSVFLTAPGAGLVSLQADSGSFVTNSGTSFAAPLVSAAAALLLSRCPDCGQAQLMDLLALCAQDKGPAGWDSAYGHGILNLEWLLRLALSVPGEQLALRAEQLTAYLEGERALLYCVEYGAQGQLLRMVPLTPGARVPELSEDAALCKLFALDPATLTPLYPAPPLDARTVLPAP